MATKYGTIQSYLFTNSKKQIKKKKIIYLPLKIETLPMNFDRMQIFLFVNQCFS